MSGIDGCLLSGWGASLLGIQVFEGTFDKESSMFRREVPDAYREAEGWSLFEHIEEREF